jgi:hypothetical protein
MNRLRDLKTNRIGKLTAVCGTVTRTSDVRPELLFGTFICLDCRAIQKNVEQQFKYTEVHILIVCVCVWGGGWVGVGVWVCGCVGVWVCGCVWVWVVLTSSSHFLILLRFIFQFDLLDPFNVHSHSH